MDWIHQVQDRDQWLAVVSTVMNLWVPWKSGSFLLSDLTIASQEGLCSMELDCFTYDSYIQVL